MAKTPIKIYDNDVYSSFECDGTSIVASINPRQASFTWRYKSGRKYFQSPKLYLLLL